MCMHAHPVQEYIKCLSRCVCSCVRDAVRRYTVDIRTTNLTAASQKAYAAMRPPYEAIETLAAAFPDLDSDIDARCAFMSVAVRALHISVRLCDCCETKPFAHSFLD